MRRPATPPASLPRRPGIGYTGCLSERADPAPRRGEDRVRAARLLRAAEARTGTTTETDRFAAWCEFARAIGVRATSAERRELERPAGEPLGDAILRLRRYALGW